MHRAKRKEKMKKKKYKTNTPRKVKIETSFECHEFLTNIHNLFIDVPFTFYVRYGFQDLTDTHTHMHTRKRKVFRNLRIHEECD